MSQKFTIMLVALGFTLTFAIPSFAIVPAPPVNQNLGIDDGVFADLAAADCRFCHEGDNPANPPVEGNCLVPPDFVEGSSQICLSDADCDTPGEECQFGVENRHHNLYNSLVPSLSIVPYPQFNTVDGRYTCLSCHSDVFFVERDCTECHNTASPHHQTALADLALCVSCHGDLVDNPTILGDPTHGDIPGDGHRIPTYEPSLVTPEPSTGNADQLNAYNNGAGACNYCHDSDTFPGGPGTGVTIVSNQDTHHGTNLENFGNRCFWCHDPVPGSDPLRPWPQPESIRTCEGCHGLDSLHNIQADSPNTNNIGTIVVGGEDAGYGHVGRDAGPEDSDCWGCHGFAGVASASAPGSGPTIPSVYGTDVSVIKAGADSVLSVSGASFSNTFDATQYTSDVTLTASDGSSTTLTPDAINESSLTVTIPGTTAVGNHELRVAKDDLTGGTVDSNPVIISVIPNVTITGVECRGKRLIITGDGFGDAPPAGSGLNVALNGVVLDETNVTSWTNTEITGDVERCSSHPVGTVNALFGSDTARSAREKIKKPKK